MKKVIRLKDGEKITLRHITKSDIEGVWRNFNEVVDEEIFLPVFTPVKSEYEKKSWYKNLVKEKEICIVADNNKCGSTILLEFRSQFVTSLHGAYLGITEVETYPLPYFFRVELLYIFSIEYEQFTFNIARI